LPASDLLDGVEIAAFGEEVRHSGFWVIDVRHALIDLAKDGLIAGDAVLACPSPDSRKERAA
jgi:hypothetical protein